MASTQLTPAERMSCALLSELFLDVRVTPHDHFIIAKRLRELDLPINAIEYMLRYEIFPVLWTNFLNITGEWAGWDEDWLADQVGKWRKNPGNLLYRGWLWLWWHCYEDYLMEHWNGIKKWLLFDKDDKVWSDKATEKRLMKIEYEMLKADWVEVQKRKGLAVMAKLDS